ncbi:hypothetical protein K469DRAFT_660141 [Zopfia rhizophila CBS 207.26]|uniref:Uncharacterized protein n=1 Tax=Zopfia rhizophila CBS 207.26 TaxID=1314779 RepID=A0A6A6EF24_9PEZI|nr:hypothetical protein K469DRAFT_626384 [Zopfia rhizophila CBS 207.26]KAF2189120.1 hypothetical protein K469DRAFT_660141 [Zopfia rhizophila CBS 207.26]
MQCPHPWWSFCAIVARLRSKGDASIWAWMPLISAILFDKASFVPISTQS